MRHASSRIRTNGLHESGSGDQPLIVDTRRIVGACPQFGLREEYYVDSSGIDKSFYYVPDLLSLDPLDRERSVV
jgi:hypothetical protein